MKPDYSRKQILKKINMRLTEIFKKKSSKEIGDSIIDIARNNPDYRIRIEAIDKISDDKFLKDAAFADSNRKVMIAAVRKISSQSDLEDIARNHSDCHVRMEAIEKIQDMSILNDIAKNESNIYVKERALRIVGEANRL